jgi:hypothetical protein
MCARVVQFKVALDALLTTWSEVVTLGTTQLVVFDHPLFKDTPLACIFRRDRPVGGSPWTINPRCERCCQLLTHQHTPCVRARSSLSKSDSKGVSYSTHGASYRQIVDFSHLDASLFVNTLGQTEQPLSPVRTHARVLGRWCHASGVCSTLTTSSTSGSRAATSQ